MDTLMRATLREAREMGVLIAEPRPPSIFDDEPEDATTADDDETTSPPSDPKSPPPRLVPITHRRK